jgi:hypothetical protein
MRYLIWDEPKKWRSEFLADVFFFDSIHSSQQPLPSNATSIVVSGVLRGCGQRIVEAHRNKIPWIHVDNGYLGKSLRVTINSTVPMKITKSSPRFDIGLRLSKWRGGQGDYILVLPPSVPYMRTFGAGNFLNNVIHGINQTTGRRIVVRAKPPYGSKRKQTSLKEDLQGAYAVIAWGSAACIDAVAMGIPTISLGWCPMSPVTFKLEDLETSELEREPNRKPAINNLTWFCFDEKEIQENKRLIMKHLNGCLTEDQMKLKKL